MAKLEFSFLKNEYDELLEEEIDLEDFLTSILKDTIPGDEGNDEQVNSMLRAYHSSDGGAPDVYDFDITDATYNFVSRKGEVTLEYVVHYYYGCDNLNKEYDDQARLSFVVDPAKQVIIFEMDDRPERDTVDEF